ncbi:hypothetical protein AaE_011667 [Aphanomyces astaci]|uniref:Uncharacterized protein n=1 Tax=Aphanomyces astaci TaxID=112090 RepID=A0A6A4ZCF4_APHAT|nr:hypothetical protein AaE_011667 [Aphanomyces astaci]
MCLRPNASYSTADPLEGQTGLQAATVFGDDIEHDLVLDFLNHLDSPTRIQTNVNFETQNGMTPLILACVLNLHLDRLLAEPTLDINYKNAFSYSALMAACEANQLGVVKKLLRQPAINRSDLNPGFCLACKGGHQALVEFLLQCPQVDLNYGMSNDDEFEVRCMLYYTGFHEACLNGHLDVVQHLVQHCGVDVNYGVPLNDENENEKDMFPHGVSSFYLACQSDHAEVVRFLLSLPQLDPRQLCNALCAAQDMDIVEMVLAHPHFNINSDVGELPPLTIACVDRQLEKLARLLAVPSIDVNFKHNNDTTAFMIACSKGFVQAVQLFLAHPELDVASVNQHGADALSITSDAGHADVVALLLEHEHFNSKAVRGQENVTCLVVACGHGYEAVVSILLQHPAIEVNAVQGVC